MTLKLTSRAFEHESLIPDKYSKDGGNISPPLTWSDTPHDTRSLALIVDDPDAPSGTFTHWLMYGIPPTTMELEEDFRARGSLAHNIRQGRNDFGELGYGGPQPPSGTHRYFFHLYALDTDLELTEGATRKELDQAIEGHVLEEAGLMGRYQHHKPGSRAA